MARVGHCTKCGEDAAWNTPYLDPDGNLICNRCGYDSPAILKGVSQFLDEAGNYKPSDYSEYTKQGIVLWSKPGSVKCWWYNGGRSYPLTAGEEKEASKNPEAFLEMLEEKITKQGLVRCTGCGVEIKESEIAGRPLFAGVDCKACWAKHLTHIENERKSGQVCRMCRKPYSLCCC